MTGHMLPIIEDLADARDDTTRAAWLLASPLSVLIVYEGVIRNQLRKAGFIKGVAYLDDVCTVCRAVRDSGEFSEGSRQIMAIALKQLIAVALPPGGDHAGE